MNKYKIETWESGVGEWDPIYCWTVHLIGSRKLFTETVPEPELIIQGTSSYRWYARRKAKKAARKHARGYDFTEERRRTETFTAQSVGPFEKLWRAYVSG